MNERIEELMVKASGGACYDGNQPALYSDDIQKFAELLVEECIGQCWTVSELESNGYVVSECSKKIRKHFGIEQ